ncbi:DUF3450 domain-containing protein [Psychromonas sp.]|uniref:DUF3450 domain-containing protein n=1 Tax=Psychromonas sp. TaxID=1884585 RepID=UPI003567C1CC
MSCTSYSLATSVEQLQKHSLTDQSDNIQAQLKINDIDDQKTALIVEVKTLQDEAQSLELYNQYLDRLLTDQDNEKASLITQINSVKHTRQGLVPLMVRMLDNLEQFINLDSPLLAQERQDRLARLKTMMAKADVSEAEKFRRLLESYHIETEYGSKMGEYQAPLRINGIERTVNYFYLGRVVFAAVSLDGKNVWAWDRAGNQWREIDASYAADIEKAIGIAKKSDIPALLRLPLLSEAK